MQYMSAEELAAAGYKKEGDVGALLETSADTISSKCTSALRPSARRPVCSHSMMNCLPLNQLHRSLRAYLRQHTRSHRTQSRRSMMMCRLSLCKSNRLALHRLQPQLSPYNQVHRPCHSCTLHSHSSTSTFRRQCRLLLQARCPRTPSYPACICRFPQVLTNVNT